MVTGIYAIVCLPTGQHYVGTALDWNRRVARHIGKLSKGKHPNELLQAAWGKHGQHNFAFKFLEACTSDQLLDKEKVWADLLGSQTGGFNKGQLGTNGSLTHGYTHNRTYKSWDAMKQRCYNKNNNRYHKYGGSGIKVCDRWLESFENFLSDMGNRPDGMTLDRFPDPHGHYQPDNCRWATPAQQQRNLRGNVYATINGEKKLAVDFAKETGIPTGVLRRRVKQGVTGDALLAPTYKSFAGVGNAKRIRTGDSRAMKYTAFGKTLTIDEWSKETGVPRTTLAQRIQKYKMPLEKALSTGPLKKGKVGPRDGKNLITAFGKTQSVTAWTREIGLPVSTIRNRLFRAKLDPELALKRE